MNWLKNRVNPIVRFLVVLGFLSNIFFGILNKDLEFGRFSLIVYLLFFIYSLFQVVEGIKEIRNSYSYANVLRFFSILFGLVIFIVFGTLIYFMIMVEMDPIPYFTSLSIILPSVIYLYIMIIDIRRFNQVRNEL